MGCGAAMVNTPDQSANEIILEMIVEAFGLLRDARLFLTPKSSL